jgi:ferritin-like metal-binding protein YciE
MKHKTIHDVFLEELKDLYSAESQLIRALPRMAKAASADSLRQAFEEHLEVTKQQKNRLERIFKQLEGTPRGKSCKAMQGILEEGKDAINLNADDAVRDAALIAAAQRVEHYEIAGYGTARTMAELLGYDDVAAELEQTLEEEQETDERLTEIAESEVNNRALEASEEE